MKNSFNYCFLFFTTIFFSFVICSCGKKKQKISERDIVRLSAQQISSKIKKGEFSAVEVVSAIVDRAKKNEHLHAYITLDKKFALDQARAIDRRVNKGDTAGLLLGVPIIVKDNIEVKGVPSTAGTPSLVDYYPQKNATVIQSLLDQGAIVIGKSNLHELAFGITSNNAHFGAVANVYNTDYSAGGSSGGVGAAVAYFLATAGVGTDTGGSVRIPSSFNGIYGYRPSIGRYEQDGLVPISESRDVAGPMARSVSDLILMDAAFNHRKPDYTPADITKLRIGVPRAYFYENIDQDIVLTVEASIDRLSKSGVELVEIDIPLPPLHFGFPLVFYEIKKNLSSYLKKNVNDDITLEDLTASIKSPDVKGIFEIAVLQNTPDQVAYEGTLLQRKNLQDVYATYFQEHDIDAVLFPTVAVSPPPIRGSDQTIKLNGIDVPTFSTVIRNMDPSSIAGLPSISLPVGMSSIGLPVGMTIDGPYGTDEKLLSIALSLEKIIGNVRPPKDNKQLK